MGTFALFVAAEAARCRTKCNDPFKLNKDECKCECASGCEAYQTQNGDDCSCVDNPCDPCAPGAEGTATAADFAQAAQPSCACTAADGDAGDDSGEGEGESGAPQLIAGAMVLAASL